MTAQKTGLYFVSLSYLLLLAVGFAPRVLAPHYSNQRFAIIYVNLLAAGLGLAICAFRRKRWVDFIGLFLSVGLAWFYVLAVSTAV